MRYVCPNPNCRKLGCYNHCNDCGKDIVWRDPRLDAEIYVRNKIPLNSDGTPHNNCMMKGVRRNEDGKRKYYFGDPILDNINYDKDLWNFLHGPEPKQYYYSKQAIEEMKEATTFNEHLESKAEWELQRAEWLKKWPVEVNPNKYVKCLSCDKLMVPTKEGICDKCYWIDVWWNQGGVKVEPQRWS